MSSPPSPPLADASASSHKRPRSTPTSEERRIAEFVDSCVHFSGTVTFHTISEGHQFANERSQRPPARAASVLLLGTLPELSAAERVASLFPYAAPELSAAIAAAPSGKAHLARLTPHARVWVGLVPTRASRHNSPSRPDAMAAIVRDVGATDALDVYCAAPGGLALVVAMARAAGRTFSAKSGNGDGSGKGKALRVVVAGRHHARWAAVARAVQLCQRLVDAPASLLNASSFASIAVGHARLLRNGGADVRVDVLAGDALRDGGFGGLHGVGKGAADAPCLATLHYAPSGAAREGVALVGKGIVYDTGGLALKPLAGMCGMKHDMGGAAAVLGGFLALAALAAPVRVAAVLCLAENAIGPLAQRNDDIVHMRSGRTVEINNTDAEGRLVLGDGVYHASALLPFTPECILDMATLTGAQGIATGRQHAALYANTEEMETRVLRASRRCGDLCFPILYCPEFHAGEFHSGVADSKNSVANRNNAQASCAAHFVESHLCPKFSGHWAHVDMAAPVAREEPTGYGVALIVETFAASLFDEE